ncbi:hypothetical protein M422DRAFT_65482 [Sphaerobolus stellatus SS14]|nr:hypothetical protein M422DRAFT_65482 [Sphaerobolus stellatus SS14]
MPTAYSVQAWIEVDGTPLTEYQVSNEGSRVTCYIPSQAGKKFTVRFRNTTPPGSGLRGNIFLDGIAAGAGLLLPTDIHATSISGQTRWEGFEAPFVFAKLKTTDDETEACQDERRLRDLGTIRIQMEWVHILRQEQWRPPSSNLSESVDQPIHERSKKASAHCTGLGDIEISRPKNWYTTVRINDIEPVDFVFQYAPLDWLKAKGITPASSSTSNTTTSSGSSNSRKRRESTIANDDSDLELLDPEEVEMYRKLKQKMSNKGPSKRTKVVKQEPRLVSLRKGSPEVIDLTGDD